MGSLSKKKIPSFGPVLMCPESFSPDSYDAFLRPPVLSERIGRLGSRRIALVAVRIGFVGIAVVCGRRQAVGEYCRSEGTTRGTRRRLPSRRICEIIAERCRMELSCEPLCSGKPQRGGQIRWLQQFTLLLSALVLKNWESCG